MAETDHPLKRLLALAAADFATWLLNQPVRRVTTRPGELTAIPDPIDTDQVLFVTLDNGRDIILHIEFQGLGSHKPVPLRLLEYNTRMILTYRDLPIYSVVIYLGGAGARDTGQHARYDLEGQVRLSWRYDVLHLWQLDGEELLKTERPALLALIGQTRMQQPEQTVSQAVTRLVHETHGEQRERLLEELLLLCSDEEIATMAEQMITQDYGLPETPMMRKLRQQGYNRGREEGRQEGREEGRQEGREEGRQEGREEGRQEGQEQERRALLLRQLARRCGPLTADTTARVQQLEAARLLDLADALLDFTSTSDLEQWLATDAPPDPQP